MDIKKFVEQNKKLFRLENFLDVFDRNIDRIIGNENEKEFGQLLSECKDNATDGDLKQRMIFKAHLRTVFLTKINIYDTDDKDQFINLKIEDTENNYIVDFIMPFNDDKNLTAKDKFEIVLYKYRAFNVKNYNEAFKTLLKTYPEIYVKENDNNTKYEITAEDIEYIYAKEDVQLNFEEKVDIIVQRLYEELYGLKDIDILAYSNVNEVMIFQGGKKIICWCGNKIRLSFLKLTDSQTELVQRRSVRYSDKGQLDSTSQEIVCRRKDGARITAICDPYSSKRELRIRIFPESNESVEGLIKDKNQQLIINALVNSDSKISLQGPLGVGKSTTMKILFELLDDRYLIGTVEDFFEQHNADKYPEKAIVELQTTHNKTFNDAVKSMLRLSVDIADLGEARSGEAFYSYIQLAQAIGGSTFLTAQVATPEDTIPRYKNFLISTKNYFSEQAAVFDVIQYVNIIFQHTMVDDNRLISDIVEVVPMVHKTIEEDVVNMDIARLQRIALIKQIQQDTAYMYRLNPLMVYDHETKEFRFKNYPSPYTITRAKKKEKSRKLMDQLLKAMEAHIGHPYQEGL